jgi:hypothetical protein
MDNDAKANPKKRTGVRPPTAPIKDDRRAEETLREQSKTEVEERPYLDTEGGE